MSLTSPVTGSVSPIKNHSTACLFLGQGPSQNQLITLKMSRQTLMSI